MTPLMGSLTYFNKLAMGEEHQAHFGGWGGLENPTLDQLRTYSPHIETVVFCGQTRAQMCLTDCVSTLRLYLERDS